MQFSRHGIPEIVVSDNGPQYDCFEYKKFEEDWDFWRITSLPRNPQSNGKVESAVKISENITKEVARGEFDPYLSFLDYRNTPTNVGSSPARRPFSRKTRNLLPPSSEQLEPVTVTQQDVHQRLIASWQKLANYNLKGKALTELQAGEIVRMKTPSENTWTEAVCNKMLLFLVAAPNVEIVDSYVWFHQQIKQCAVVFAVSSHMLRMVARSSPSVHHLKEINLFQSA